MYTDGGCGKYSNGYGYASVVDENGCDLIQPYKHIIPSFDYEDVSLPVGKRTIIKCKFDGLTQQVNGAELLGMIFSLTIYPFTGHKVIYCDSDLIIKYWSKGNCKISDKKELSELCSKLRTKFEQDGGKIIKISGKDNKADLGYHR